MEEPQLGQYLGRYRLDALLGEGGMALVYRAVDTAVGRDVALKVVHPSLARDPAFVARFLREARVVGRLQHPNILPLYDTGEQDHRPYLVMPYMAAGTLEDWLARGHTPTEILAFVRPIAAALDYAHERGVIHRDVKPTNVLIAADGTPLLADFGIAHAIGDSKLTVTGMHIGSSLYMAPEQAQGVPLSGAADQYALGSMLYEALVGRPPYILAHADTSFSLMLRKLSQPPPPPTSLNPALSPACDAVLLRALAREPGQRFPTCVALVDALAYALANPWAPPPAVTAALPSPAPQIPVPPPQIPRVAVAPVVRKGRSAWWIVGGVALALIVVLIGATIFAARVMINRNPGNAPGAGGRATAAATRTASRTAAQSGGGQQAASIGELTTTDEIRNDHKPNGKSSEFKVGEQVYITYTANKIQPGQYVDLRIFSVNGTAVYNDRNTFENEVNYNGYFIYTPDAAGTYRVELYFNGSKNAIQTTKITVR
jgi:Protein kinase domain